MRVLRKFTCLAPADRRLLVTAALVLGLVGAALRLVSFKKLLQLTEEFSHTTSQRQNPLPPSSERITWAIAAVSRRIPLLSRCLTQAVASKDTLGSLRSSCSHENRRKQERKRAIGGPCLGREPRSGSHGRTGRRSFHSAVEHRQR